MKKNGQKENILWRKKQQNKGGKTRGWKQSSVHTKKEAKATRQNRHKFQKERRKIINYCRQEEVKTSEISDK